MQIAKNTMGVYNVSIMQWIKEYQLFLFDFDGLLVNTEELQYQAYCRLCKKYGFEFQMDFPSYCKIAHYDSSGLKEKIYGMNAELRLIQPDWQVLYAEKKQAFVDLVQESKVSLMPGVEKLLLKLQAEDVKRCVVTHSAKELISVIREQNPVLNTIPHWITRENYTQPKPNPESYLTAIARLADEKDKIIGFEDSPRGLTALMGTRAKPVLICTIPYPEISTFIQKGVEHYSSFEQLL